MASMAQLLFRIDKFLSIVLMKNYLTQVSLEIMTCTWLQLESKKIQRDDRLIRSLKKVKIYLFSYLYKELYHDDSQPEVVFSLTKIHKP